MKGNISISRNSRNVINIEVQDEKSRIRFVTVEMTPEQFAMAITGLSAIPVEIETKGLSFVGKTRVIEPRQIECPLNGYDRKQAEEWLRQNAQEHGWILDEYLGSQNSIRRQHEPEPKTILHYAVYRYE